MDSPLDAKLLLISVIFLILAVWLVIAIATRRRLMDVNRRRIMASGAICDGLVTWISTPSSSGRCWVHLEYRPTPNSHVLRFKQLTTQSAVQRLGLSTGATLSIRQLREKPAQAFVHELVLAERGLRAGVSFATEVAQSELFYFMVKPPNNLGCTVRATSSSPPRLCSSMCKRAVRSSIPSGFSSRLH